MLLLLRLKRQDFVQNFLEKAAFYGLDTEPDLEPALVKSRTGTGTVINSRLGSATLTILYSQNH